MNTAGVIRRVQNLFGDNSEVIITKNMMIDWINEGQMEIARETQYRSAYDSSNDANDFIDGLAIPDLLATHRIYYSVTPLVETTLDQIDRWGPKRPAGIPQYYYSEGEKLFLYPTPLPGDTTEITINYVDTPTDLVTEASALDIPIKYHGDLVEYVLSKAHRQNEAYQAADAAMGIFMKNMGQRRWEAEMSNDANFVMPVDSVDLLDGNYC